MRKLVLLVSAILMTTTVFATPTTLDTKALAKSILNMHKSTATKKDSFIMVYGGQDISRGVSPIPAVLG